MSETASHKYSENLDPGDQFSFVGDPQVIQVISNKKCYPLTGVLDADDLFRYWCKSVSTGEEFWVTFSPGESVDIR